MQPPRSDLWTQLALLGALILALAWALCTSALFTGCVAPDQWVVREYAHPDNRSVCTFQVTSEGAPFHYEGHGRKIDTREQQDTRGRPGAGWWQYLFGPGKYILEEMIYE